MIKRLFIAVLYIVAFIITVPLFIITFFIVAPVLYILFGIDFNCSLHKSFYLMDIVDDIEK